MHGCSVKNNHSQIYVQYNTRELTKSFSWNIICYQADDFYIFTEAGEAWQRLNPGLNINKSFIIMGNVFYLWGLAGWASAVPPHCLYLTFHRPEPVPVWSSRSSAFNASCLRTMENFNFKLSLIKTSESFPEGYVRKKGFLIS